MKTVAKMKAIISGYPLVGQFISGGRIAKKGKFVATCASHFAASLFGPAVRPVQMSVPVSVLVTGAFLCAPGAAQACDINIPDPDNLFQGISVYVYSGTPCAIENPAISTVSISSPASPEGTYFVDGGNYVISVDENAEIITMSYGSLILPDWERDYITRVPPRYEALNIANAGEIGSLHIGVPPEHLNLENFGLMGFVTTRWREGELTDDDEDAIDETYEEVMEKRRADGALRIAERFDRPAIFAAQNTGYIFSLQLDGAGSVYNDGEIRMLDIGQDPGTELNIDNDGTIGTIRILASPLETYTSNFDLPDSGLTSSVEIINTGTIGRADTAVADVRLPDNIDSDGSIVYWDSFEPSDGEYSVSGIDVAAQNVFIMNSEEGVIYGGLSALVSDDFIFENYGSFQGRPDLEAHDNFHDGNIVISSRHGETGARAGTFRNHGSVFTERNVNISVSQLENAGQVNSRFMTITADNILNSGSLHATSIFVSASELLNSGSISVANAEIHNSINISGIYVDAGGSIVLDVNFTEGADFISVFGSIEGVMSIDLVDITSAGSMADYLSRIDLVAIFGDEGNIREESVQIANLDPSWGYELMLSRPEDEFDAYVFYLGVPVEDPDASDGPVDPENDNPDHSEPEPSDPDEPVDPVEPEGPPADLITPFTSTPSAIHTPLLRALHDQSFMERRELSQRILSGEDYAIDLRVMGESVTSGNGLRDEFFRSDLEIGFNLANIGSGALIGSAFGYYGVLSVTLDGSDTGVFGYSGIGHGGGLGLTYLSDGFYADARAGLHKWNLTIPGVDGRVRAGGQSGSFEIGYQIALSDWTVTPSAQYSQARIRTDAFTSAIGVEVAEGTSTSRQGRLGLHVAREWSDERNNTLRGFAAVNRYRETGSVISRGTWTEMGLGGSYSSSDGSRSISASVHTPVSGAGRGRDIRASLGVSLRF